MAAKRFTFWVLGWSVAANSVGVPTALATTHAITHTQTDLDATDFQALGYGREGYYFPQFDGVSPATERPTFENMAFDPPSWASFQFDVTQPDRTFSLDAGLFSGDFNDPLDEAAPFGNPLVAGVYTKGGQPAWDWFTLPDGAQGLSGAAVDEAADDNSNNSVNRIQLGVGTPSSFLLRIVVDNTNGEHDAAGRLRARGDTDNAEPVDVDADLSGLTFDGSTDVYSFRYDNFVVGDFIKIQLNSGVPGEAPSIGGIMFDVVPEPSATLLGLVSLGSLAIVRAQGQRSRRGAPRAWPMQVGGRRRRSSRGPASARRAPR
jgi:hypothetical protein